MSDESSFLSIAGLSALTEQIYLFVLHRGEATVQETGDRFELSPQDAEQELESLRDLGFIARAGATSHYSPVDPSFALSAVASRLTDRVARIRDQIPELAAAFLSSTAPSNPSGRTQVLSDRGTVASWYVRIQHQAARELMMFDRPPYVSSPLEPLEAVIIGRGVRWRGLYTSDSFTREGAWEETSRLAEQGEESRIVPTLPIKLAMADHSIALISLSLDGVHNDALITESPPLLDVLAELFETQWARGLPLFEKGRSQDETLASTEREQGVRMVRRDATREERSILALVGAGLTDEAIAERLGISVRSLRRRSARLMEELGASNRFQAGVEAARRGWV